ncbi:hypothetical protein LWP59_00300 [Amycolatopsis acidiphila]|uniref:Uncharacterized protein n=1 Tax=Amycolatopsis acidiphila TaxID=715473 RepID=A0A558AFU0_9PSEU|nr:hypothetical protein [Amycolatopsis acidiphila]TVT23130.1 hypothetical protein FNH06_10935 [Amycolatopsis acidiphila]UIJ60183.1 hypothetical protein LWP59_00300 [Amycolatopsis acidiphila]GHG60896.1 hypothetical protein GCM10017788_15040 [Amycolatopsis acidiphila]
MEFMDSIPAARATAQAHHHHVGPMRTAARSAVPAVTDPRAAQVRRYESGQLVWRVQCGDMINRERCVTVLVQDGQVVLVGPPGETARLTAGQLGQLRAALNEAAKLTER